MAQITGLRKALVSGYLFRDIIGFGLCNRNLSYRHRNHSRRHLARSDAKRWKLHDSWSISKLNGWQSGTPSKPKKHKTKSSKWSLTHCVRQRRKSHAPTFPPQGFVTFFLSFGLAVSSHLAHNFMGLWLRTGSGCISKSGGGHHENRKLNPARWRCGFFCGLLLLLLYLFIYYYICAF